MLDEEDKRFLAVKVSQRDVRAENVLPVIKDMFSSESVIYLPDYIDNAVSVSAIADVLYRYLDKEFFLEMEGTMGTIYRSILPSLEIDGEYSEYPDIDEKVIFYALMKGMDRVAKLKGKDRMVWVFGRIDFTHDYRYSRFIKFLHGKRSHAATHICIAVGYPSDVLNLPAVNIDVSPHYRFEDLVSLPFKDPHRKLMGVLALTSEHTSGHNTVSFVSRLMEKYPWTKRPFKDLLEWGVIEQYGYYFYSFTNMEFFHYALRHFVSRDAENIALSLMRRNLHGNMLLVARLSKRRGDIRKALATITMYARDILKNGRYRKAYEEILPYYREYCDYLSFPQMMFYLKLASSTEHHDEELTGHIADKLILTGRWKYSSLPYLAKVMPPSDKADIFWQDLYLKWKDRPYSLQKALVLSSVFIYLWREGKVPPDLMEKLNACAKIPWLHDKMLTVLVNVAFGRASILMGDIDKARSIFERLAEVIENSGLWFFAHVVFNNLFVSFHYSDGTYPAVRLLSLLFKAYESALLYRSSRVSVSITNYLIISASASRKYTEIKDMAQRLTEMLENFSMPESVISTYYAMSFVSMDYGYREHAMTYIEEMKSMLDSHGWDNFSYIIKMWYYFALAHFYMMNGDYDKAQEILSIWENHIGIYGEGYTKKNLILEGIEIMKGLKKPDSASTIYYYRYYTSRKEYQAGIEMLEELFKEALHIGDMLEMANAKRFMAYLYEKLGDSTLAREYLYDAYGMYRQIESYYAKEIKFSLSSLHIDMVPDEMWNVYISRLMLVELFSELALEKYVKDVMLKILSSIFIPASGMWMLFQWDNFTDFVGFTLIKGETYKFGEFYLSPSEIDSLKDYEISLSPSYVYVVVKSSDAIVVIYGENRYMENAFSQQDISLMRQFGENIIGLLLKMKMGEQAMYDFLTGVYSRWYLIRQIERELARQRRNNTPVSLLFIDVDDFKHVNDTYGHDMGDRVLKRLGQIILENIRNVDIAGRYGGEEFVILLPDTNTEGAYVVAERIRSAVENDPNLEVPITVSIGVITVTPDTDYDVVHMLKMADMAMYRAKNLGKNMVFIWGEHF